MRCGAKVSRWLAALRPTPADGGRAPDAGAVVAAVRGAETDAGGEAEGT